MWRRSSPKITGVPVTELTAEEKDKLQLEDKLHERVIGRKRLSAPWPMLCGWRARPARGRGPTATFLFLGPTGVGKTELAQRSPK